MNDAPTAPPAQPARPRVAFLAVPGGSHPVRSVEVLPGGYVVAVNTTIPGFDHASAAKVMRVLIGDFEDCTVPGAFEHAGPTLASVQRDIHTVLAAEGSAPVAVAEQLLTTIVDTTADVERRPGRENWPQAEQNSDTAYALAEHLIADVLRRYVIGAHRDGRRPASAARRMRQGLIAACQVAAAEYTGGAR